MTVTSRKIQNRKTINEWQNQKLNTCQLQMNGKKMKYINCYMYLSYIVHSAGTWPFFRSHPVNIKQSLDIQVTVRCLFELHFFVLHYFIYYNFQKLFIVNKFVIKISPTSCEQSWTKEDYSNSRLGGKYHPCLNWFLWIYNRNRNESFKTV